MNPLTTPAPPVTPVRVRVHLDLSLTANVDLVHLFPDGPPETPEQLAATVDAAIVDFDDERTDLAIHDALAEAAIHTLATISPHHMDILRIDAAVPNPAYGQDDSLPGIDPPPATTTITWEPT